VASADRVAVADLIDAKARVTVAETPRDAVDVIFLPNVLTTDAVNERLFRADRTLENTLVTEDETDRLTLAAVSFAQFLVTDVAIDRLAVA
jgi:hypothetical protein